MSDLEPIVEALGIVPRAPDDPLTWWVEGGCATNIVFPILPEEGINPP